MVKAVSLLTALCRTQGQRKETVVKNKYGKKLHCDSGQESFSKGDFFVPVVMSADNELSAILNRRQNLNDAIDNGEDVEKNFVKVREMR